MNSAILWCGLPACTGQTAGWKPAPQLFILHVHLVAIKTLQKARGGCIDQSGFSSAQPHDFKSKRRFPMLRRNFIVQMGSAAVGAAAIPSLLRACGRSAPAEPRETARLAFIGVRGRGTDHVKEFGAMKDVQIAAIVDPDENVIAKAMKLANDYGAKQPRYEKDVRKILEDKSIDGVIVATPNHWHTLTSI